MVSLIYTDLWTLIFTFADLVLELWDIGSSMVVFPLVYFGLICSGVLGGYTRVYGVYQPPGFFDCVYSPQ